MDRSWREIVRNYQRPSLPRSIEQVGSSIGAYLVVLAAIYWLAGHSLWFILPLAPIASILLLRVFIVFHDCGHGSFFPSRRANRWVGRLAGLLVFTPFAQWSHEHAVHHAGTNNLDRRGTGDVTTLTVDEYLTRGRWSRAAYRLYRNPFVMFGLGGSYLHLFQQRFAGSDASPRDKRSVRATNLALVVLYGGLMLWMGPWLVLAVQFPIIALASSVGVWLFYVQHQFEDAFWARQENWDFAVAALEGSSYLQLPRLLHWCTGNIGFHHVHHLSSRIPNYRLRRAHEENELFHASPRLTLVGALRTMRLKLWDEPGGRLISWQELRRLRRQASAA